METQALQKSIQSSADTARAWFLKRAVEKNRIDWETKNGLSDSGVGAVYAFFNENDQCLYIGQTTQSIKSRANIETSRHYDKEWWPSWTKLRFVNIQNQTDQLVIELLLILSLSPQHNSKPSARIINDMFPPSNPALNSDAASSKHRPRPSF